MTWDFVKNIWDSYSIFIIVVCVLLLIWVYRIIRDKLEARKAAIRRQEHQEELLMNNNIKPNNYILPAYKEELEKEFERTPMKKEPMAPPPKPYVPPGDDFISTFEEKEPEPVREKPTLREPIKQEDPEETVLDKISMSLKDLEKENEDLLHTIDYDIIVTNDKLKEIRAKKERIRELGLTLGIYYKRNEKREEQLQAMLQNMQKMTERNHLS